MIVAPSIALLSRMVVAVVPSAELATVIAALAIAEVVFDVA